MPKRSGINERLYLDGVDASGTIMSLDSVNQTMAEIGTTTLEEVVKSRLQGIMDTEFSAGFVYSTDLTGQFESLPRRVRHASWFEGIGLGDPVFNMVVRQTSFNYTRSDTGALTGKVDMMGDGDSEWGIALTDPVDMITSSGIHIPESIDLGSSWGTQTRSGNVYAHVLHDPGSASFKISLQTSANNSSWGPVATSPAISDIGAVVLPFNGTIRRYIRISAADILGVSVEVEFAASVTGII